MTSYFTPLGVDNPDIAQSNSRVHMYIISVPVYSAYTTLDKVPSDPGLFSKVSDKLSDYP